MRTLLCPLLATLILLPLQGLHAEVGGGIDVARIRGHIEYLASDALEGRFTGAPGCEQAAGYIAGHMTSIGLEPMGDNGSWFDTFTFTSGVRLGPNNAARLSAGAIATSLTEGSDWVPLFFSSNATMDAPVVFAGYGITSPDHGWDDYKDLDVAGKIVLVLRYEPGVDDPDSPFAGKQMTRFSDVRQKAIRAREAGAIGLLLVNGMNGQGGKTDELAGLSQVDSAGEVGIPVAQLSRRHANTLLATVGLTIESLEVAMTNDYTPVAVDLPEAHVRCVVDLERTSTSSSNVVGMLPGNDPAYAHEIIVIGAHYDHLGLGQTGSLAVGSTSVHNGADDNASGVAGVLELARTLSLVREQLQRSVCFVAFSGEELGLYGSSHFAKEPPFPLTNVVAMINMDMIGRLDAAQKLIVLGSGTAEIWPPAIDGAATGLPLQITMTDDGVGPSDQTSFVAQRIPVLMFFTGAHDDYHKPSDDADKINYPGEVAILTLIYRILEPLALGEFTPVYTEVQGGADPHSGMDTSRGFNIYLGTIPDYAITDRLVLQGVRESGPGWEAGLRGGDQIIQFGDIAIGNVYDYTYALQTYQPGDEVDLVILRGDNELTFHLTLVGKAAAESNSSAHGDPEAGHAHE